MMPKAVVLLSGGLDSAVTLAIALNDGTDVTAVSFRYGQRHRKELDSADAVCRHYGIKNCTIDIDLSSFRSSLTDKRMTVPSNRKGRPDEEIPSTYVPARNIIFLSIAAGVCESIDAEAIYIGANAVDFSGYPDCRPEFFTEFREMLAVGTKTGAEGKAIDIRTPIIDLSKADIVRKGKELKTPLHLTWSCYKGGDEACGTCDSCRLRLKGFREAGFKDEICYR
jgi:7-cyano-7-deazaguanine synthase